MGIVSCLEQRGNGTLFRRTETARVYRGAGSGAGGIGWTDKTECIWTGAALYDRRDVGPEIFNEENAYTYGRFFANRYRECWNIIWMLGGDRKPKNLL